MEFPTMSSRCGFTLIELLVATVIIGLAIVPMISAYTHSIQATTSAQRKSLATMLSRKRLETVAGTTKYANISSGSTSGNFKPPYEDYSYFMEVQKVSGTDPDLEVKQLKIKIEFPSLTQGGRRTISCEDSSNCNKWDFITFVSKRNP